MRRILAALMTVVVLMAIVEPLAASASVPALQACCRRGGMHHCMASPSLPDSNSPIVANAPDKCPMRRSVRSTANTYFTIARRAMQTAPVADSVVVAYEPVIFLSAGFSSHTDRGPPSEA